MSEAKFRGDRCYLCGSPCVDAVDNFGQAYRGCPRCIIELDPGPALTDEERAERAWKEFAAGYYAPGSRFKTEAELFKSGYLAALKEKP